jgi:hypothetical protein
VRNPQKKLLHLEIFLIEDIFGSMMTYLEKDVLPFPNVKGIDLGPAMKRKVFVRKVSFI